MQEEDLQKILEDKNAIEHGHFKLSSGKHSDTFIQKFRILENPKLVVRIAHEIVQKMEKHEPTLVVSAAVGGIVLGYEVAKQLGVKAIFVEKMIGEPVLRRGFTINEKDQVLIVEDVVTTGKSVQEIIDVVRKTNAKIVGIATIISRENKEFEEESIALLNVPVASFEAQECPQCKLGTPIQEPGSRFLK